MRKRCVACGFECPLLEASLHFYTRKWRGDGFQARCKACEYEHVKAHRQANPDRARAHGRMTRERIKADPERLAEKRAYNREFMRRKRGTPPERYLTGREVLTGPLVPVAALLPAVAASGLPEATISLAAGYADSTVTKALKRETVSLEMAVRVLRVLDVAPAEVGL